MQLEHGFKPSEVGAIPADWEALPFGDVLRKLSAKNHQIQTREYGDSGTYPVVDQGQALVVGYSNRRDKVFPVPKGGVIIFGDHTCIVKLQQDDFVVGADGVQILEPRAGHDAAFHRYALAHRGVEPTGYNRHFKFLKERWFQTPPYVEQRAISQALSDVDELLGGLNRLISKQRAVTHATMQQLLTGRIRLPGFGSSATFTEAGSLGQFPSDWRPERLSALVQRSRGIRYGIVQPGDYDPSGRYMIRGQDYSEAKGWADPSEVFRVSPGVEERYRNARVKAGDLIMTIVGYCGHVELVPEWLDGANLTQTTARIAVDPTQAVGVFCRYMLMGPVGRNQVAASLKGAAQPGLNCGDIEKFLLPLPSIPEQAAIATVLSDMETEVAALKARRDKTRALKQAMMQELVTGRTRLVKPEVMYA